PARDDLPLVCLGWLGDIDRDFRTIERAIRRLAVERAGTGVGLARVGNLEFPGLDLRPVFEVHEPGSNARGEVGHRLRRSCSVSAFASFFFTAGLSGMPAVRLHRPSARPTAWPRLV